MYLRSITATAILLSSVSAASALEGKALLDKFLSSQQMSKNTVTWGTLSEENSSSFTMMDVVITKKSNGEKITFKSVSVRGLREDGGRMTYDTLAVSDVKGATKRGGDISVGGVASTNGSFPIDIWKDGLTAEEKRQRISFGNFTVNGVAIANRETEVNLGAVVMTNADIPLDFRFDPEDAAEATTEPAAPLKFDQFAVTGLKGSNEGVTFGMNSMTIAGVNFPTTMRADVGDWMKIYSAVSLNGMTASLGDMQVFALNSLSGTIDPADSDGTINTTSTLDGLMVYLKAIPDPQTQAIAQQLGYDRIEGKMVGQGSYNPNTGRADVSNIMLNLKDMFDLAMNYSVTGYTPEVVAKIQEAQVEMAKGKSQMEAFGAIMPVLSNVKLEGIKLALTDRSLTGKLLDFQAKQMGTTGDQLASGAPMMIGMGMGGLGMPALTEMVTKAVGTFLQTKGTLTVEAVPPQPVPIMNLVMTGQGDPTKIPDMINLKVSAE